MPKISKKPSKAPTPPPRMRHEARMYRPADKRPGKSYYGRRPGGIDDVIASANQNSRAKMKGVKRQTVK